MAQTCCGKMKVSTWPIFNHVQGTDLSYKFKLTENWKRGER
jgi:hypothetical protein